MRYINSTLTKNETVMAELEKTKWEYLKLIILSPLLLISLFPSAVAIVPLIIFFSWFVIIFLKRWSTEIAYTNKRVIVKRGLISRYTDELRLSKIESIDIDQNFWGRILSFGDILITGTGGKRIVLNNLSDVVSVRKSMTELLAN